MQQLFENVCSIRKLDLQLKNFFMPILKTHWKDFCVAIKKLLVIQFPYKGIVWWSFFKKNSVFSTPDCFIRLKQPQKLVYIFFAPFFREIVGKLYDEHFSIYLMHGFVW